ncbi:MAG: HAD family hydrolase [Lachnospiraceae bacterium]|nr:HAD family hydrolase [Lachnospiraceae bacterium]
MNHLIFDIDGTLWNTTGVVAGAWNGAIKAANIPELKDLNVTDKMLQKEFGKPMDVIADDLFGPIDAGLKAKLLDHCCELEHIAIDENTEDLTYPGVKEVIRELSKNNKLYIVSNCQNGYIELVMKKLGIEDIIDDIECFGHTGLQKSENIGLVVKRNNIDKAYYIGDTYGDYTATKEAGCEFIFAEYGFGEVDNPDYVIKQFSDLLKMFN